MKRRKVMEDDGRNRENAANWCWPRWRASWRWRCGRGATMSSCSRRRGSFGRRWTRCSGPYWWPRPHQRRRSWPTPACCSPSSWTLPSRKRVRRRPASPSSGRRASASTTRRRPATESKRPFQVTSRLLNRMWSSWLNRVETKIDYASS